jgi:prepilin-type N-terminal cleavage/methylation domain-containing protein
MIIRSQKGVTLLELLMSMAVLGILALIVSRFYVDRLIDYARNDSLIILQSNTKQALESLKRDIQSARTIETTNQWPDPNGPGGNQFGWNSNNGSPSTLVLAVPATNSTGNLIYVDPAHSGIHTNDVIYYVDSSKKLLYRRVIANPVAGNTARTTCPPPGNAACPPDGQVIEDIANMVVTYFDTNNASTSIVANVYSLDVALSQSRNKFGRTYSNTLKSRATLRNKP